MAAQGRAGPRAPGDASGWPACAPARAESSGVFTSTVAGGERRGAARHWEPAGAAGLHQPCSRAAARWVRRRARSRRGDGRVISGLNRPGSSSTTRPHRIRRDSPWPWAPSTRVGVEAWAPFSDPEGGTRSPVDTGRHNCIGCGAPNSHQATKHRRWRRGEIDLKGPVDTGRHRVDPARGVRPRLAPVLC